MSKNQSATDGAIHLNRETHVFIDVSNIREACRKGCKFIIDFSKLYNYFQTKYPNLGSVRYYEGIAVGDAKKQATFKSLQGIGYTVCPLTRKSYTTPPRYEKFQCPKCLTSFRAMTLPKTVKMKSNVDVYLASDLLELVATTKSPVHIILLSCDGDYAEAIKVALRLNPNILITVLATPITKKNNFLSTRLQSLSKVIDRQHFKINDISQISHRIS
ncbi:MAG: NYN domain-containing protein [Candidatus Saccharibacteria bacterium]|nr:NYN domain-containing protein [Candidatus Saccharibacteria bacterium]